MIRVRQILFVAPAPLVWAAHLGAFASNGLDVETTQTLSSDQIGQGLALQLLQAAGGIRAVRHR